MKKKLYTAMILSGMVLAVTACSTKEESPDVPPSSTKSTMDIPTETDTADQVENETAATAPETIEDSLTEAALSDMSSSIGKKDEEAIDLLGGASMPLCCLIYFVDSFRMISYPSMVFCGTGFPSM